MGNNGEGGQLSTIRFRMAEAKVAAFLSARAFFLSFYFVLLLSQQLCAVSNTANKETQNGAGAGSVRSMNTNLLVLSNVPLKR